MELLVLGMLVKENAMENVTLNALQNVRAVLEAVLEYVVVTVKITVMDVKGPVTTQHIAQPALNHVHLVVQHV